MEIIQRKLTIWTALAGASVLESIRRKDLYVAMIIALLMIISSVTIGSFGVEGIEVFLKDVALTVINWVSMLIAILFAARQMPEEISRRTVYPLLARPISRGDLLFGKWLGAFTLSAVALTMFSAIGIGALVFYKIAVGAIFWQYFFLRLLSLAVLCAMTLLLSLLMTPGATITIACLLAIGSSTFSNFVLMVDGAVANAVRGILRGAYFLLPHLDLFDLSKKVSYGWKPVEGWVLRDLFLYAVLYVAVFLFLGTLRFRRQAV
ncbi:MAG: hypothetical protein OHK0029_14680 [Armatimonadaceae bacterium]